MQVILAQAMGLCFGVRDALQLARGVDRPAEVTIRGELVHNAVVQAELAQRGFQIQPEATSATMPATEFVMITAHGISNCQRQRLEQAGKRLLDTTCPLVERVHGAAHRLAREGRLVLVIGRPGHVEVQGLVDDLPEAVVVPGPDAVRNYAAARLGVVCQSTTPPHVAHETLQAICRANPQADLRFEDTICQPTRDRQQALLRLLPLVQAVVVVGGKNSNNTAELVRLCGLHGVPALHVQCAADLDPAWFRGCVVVGLTAGTSTLDTTIAEVHRALLALPAAGSQPLVEPMPNDAAGQAGEGMPTADRPGDLRV